MKADLLIILPALLLGVAATAPPPAQPSPGATPITTREVFNAGTAKLQAGKLREAEAFLESALAAQNEKLQPPALYNLGHVRFQQGVEELKKGPSEGRAASRGQAASLHADDAIRIADEALAGEDIEKMVSAYLHGRGVRKELKAATEAVRQAMEVYGRALNKWERASGDFKSVVELKTSDDDAKQNADLMDRYIAKLVDSVRRMQQMAMGQGGKCDKLGEKLKQLKGRIPADQMPPGAGGDEDEDDDKPFGPRPDQKEGPSRDGKEIALSPEQAGWLLEGFKLDKDRRLPMGQGTEAKPRDRNGPTW